MSAAIIVASEAIGDRMNRLRHPGGGIAGGAAFRAGPSFAAR
jgi:hypothetical protein